VLCEVGHFTVAEFTIPAGFDGPPPHRHHDFDEGFYVLDGTLDALLGQERIQVPAGAFVRAPRGTRHAFRNSTAWPARLLGYWAPARGLTLVDDIGELITATGVPEPMAIAELYCKHHSERA
jgi:mannose-6-phosphate isomerase-like protein (cupin superfamily)